MKTLQLYLLTQDYSRGYNIYDSAVVCAEDEEDARRIHPFGDDRPLSDDGMWAPSPWLIEVKHLGAAVEGVRRGIVLASFNAG